MQTNNLSTTATTANRLSALFASIVVTAAMLSAVAELARADNSPAGLVTHGSRQGLVQA